MAISEIVTVNVTIECRKCQSKNTKITDWKMWGEEEHKEKTWDLDHEYWVTDSYKKAYDYRCKDCGYVGTEYGDKRYYC